MPRKTKGPALARTTSNGRAYSWLGQEYPSVTTVLSNGIPKPVLVPWAKKVTAQAAVENVFTLEALIAEQGSDAAIRWLTRHPDLLRDEAADLGTDVHAAIDEYVKKGTVSVEGDSPVAPFLSQFARYLEDHKPSFAASEFTVFSLECGYAGTADAAVKYPNREGLTLLDVKTGKNVYPEVALQLAAYANADFIGEPDGTSRPLPAFDYYEVLHLRADGYAVVPVKVDLDVFAAFLSAKHVHDWVRVQSKTVLGGGE